MLTEQQKQQLIQLSSQCTFVSQLYIDDFALQQERLENYKTVLRYYKQLCPNSRFILLWVDQEVDRLKHILTTTPDYQFFLTEPDLCLFTTTSLPRPLYQPCQAKNLLARDYVETPFFICLEVDVIVSDQNLLEAFQAVMEMKSATVSWPFNGTFINVRNPYRQQFCQTLNYQELERQLQLYLQHNEERAYQDTEAPFHYVFDARKEKSVGGLFLFETETFWKIGGWHEGIIAWGYDDLELHMRCQKLEVPIFRSSGPLFHLNHSLSHKQHPFLQSQNATIYAQTVYATKEQLQQTIPTWPWVYRKIKEKTN